MDEGNTEKKEDMTEENKEKTEMSIDNNPDKSGSSKIMNKIKENPWMVSTIVLGVVALILLILVMRGGITGNVIGGSDAGTTLVDYLNEMTGGGVEYVSHEDLGNLYEVIVSYQGQDLPVYITKDGEYFVQGAIPMTGDVVDTLQEQTPADVPKSDRPKVELFIWSYCPYGVQAQGPLADVASLLKDSADFETVLYYDGHGDYETQQNKIQACIQEAAQDKYWKYAEGFVDDIYPKCSSLRDIECDKTESVKLMKSLGINDLNVMSCVDEKGEDLVAEYSARANAYGVTGSPSLIINGVKVNTARNADAFKTAVCESFNDAPSECSTVLESSSAAASGNC